MITLLKQNVTPYPFIRTIMWDYFLKRLSYTLFMRRHFEMKIVLMRIVAICRRLFLHQLSISILNPGSGFISVYKNDNLSNRKYS